MKNSLCETSFARSCLYQFALMKPLFQTNANIFLQTGAIFLPVLRSRNKEAECYGQKICHSAENGLNFRCLLKKTKLLESMSLVEFLHFGRRGYESEIMHYTICIFCTDS